MRVLELASVQILVSSRHFEIHPNNWKWYLPKPWDLLSWAKDIAINKSLWFLLYFHNWWRYWKVWQLQFSKAKGWIYLQQQKRLYESESERKKSNWNKIATNDWISSLLAGLRKMSTRGGSSSCLRECGEKVERKKKSESEHKKLKKSVY